ncbi:MAG TPA: hypothetical protein VFA18_04595 [Gemmataceae bacterium]|nr:hypothetical protein [Gemmataceae bacterium]
MIVPSLIVVAAGLLLATPALQEHRTLPKQKQPMFALARMDRDGMITVQSKIIKYRDEIRSGAGGQQVIKMVPYEDVGVYRMGKDVQVFVTDGKGAKKVDPKRLKDLLKKQTHVLITPAGERLDPFYAEAVKE